MPRCPDDRRDLNRPGSFELARSALAELSAPQRTELERLLRLLGA